MGSYEQEVHGVFEFGVCCKYWSEVLLYYESGASCVCPLHESCFPLLFFPLQVVPTTYKSIDGMEIFTNQYSVSEYFHEVDPKTSALLAGMGARPFAPSNTALYHY